MLFSRKRARRSDDPGCRPALRQYCIMLHRIRVLKRNLPSNHHHMPIINRQSYPKNPSFRMGSEEEEKKGKSYEERCEAVNVISQPLASKKSTKKAHKLVKKAASAKHIRRGVKEVVKGIRKGEHGVAILAGDIYPVDVISHLPVLLEEKSIPYVFVPSKQDLGAAASTKRPTSCVLIKTPPKDFDGKDLYDALVKEAKDYDPTCVTAR